MTDREKAFLLHISLAAFESVRADELPKTARRTKMDWAIDKVIEMVMVGGRIYGII